MKRFLLVALVLGAIGCAKKDADEQDSSRVPDTSYIRVGDSVVKCTVDTVQHGKSGKFSVDTTCP